MKKITRLKHLIFFFLILFLPSQLGYHFWPNFSLVSGIRVDYLSPTLYLTDIFVILLFILSIKKIKFTKPYSIYFIAFLLFALFNIYVSSSPFLSLYKWIKITEVTFLSYFVYLHKRKIIKSIQKPLVIALGYTCVIAIGQWIKGGSLNGIFYLLGERSFNVSTPGIALGKLGDSVYLRPYATLPHPNALAGFLLVSYFLLNKEQNKNMSLLLVCVLTPLTIFLTQSYAVWLCVLFILLFQLLRVNFHKVSPITKKISILGFYYLCLASPIIFSLLNLRTTNKNLVERISLSVISGQLISKNLLAGVGFGTFITHLPAYFSGRVMLLQPVHNVPLLIFTELGIIGSILFVFLLFNLSINIPLFVIMLTSLFDHYWLTLQSPILLLAIVAGLSYNRRNR